MCEQAINLLDELHDRYTFEMEVVDISNEENLVQKYGLIIPVVLNVENNELLCWPFDKDSVVKLLSDYGLDLQLAN